MTLSSFLPKLIFGVVIVYLAGLAALYVMQDRMIYFPDATPAGEPPYEGVRNVQFTSEDGKNIEAWYAPALEGCPTFLFLHGNGSHIAQDTARYYPMLKQGTGFLAVSWPGYAASEGKPGEAAFHTAAEASVNWMTNEGLALRNVIVHGDSIGSGPAAYLATKHSFGALILEEPYFSMTSLVAEKMPFIPAGLILKSTFRSDKWIGDVQMPLLIVHGEADTLIPPAHSARLFEIANDPKLRETLPGAPHSGLVEAGLYDRIWPFLAEYWNDSDCFSDTSNTSEVNQ